MILYVLLSDMGTKRQIIIARLSISIPGCTVGGEDVLPDLQAVVAANQTE